jgi:hypothetical protein
MLQKFFPLLGRRGWVIGYFLAIAAGIVFRLIWLEDIEFKDDEAWTFSQVRAFWQTHHLALVGMESSVGIPNAGMSLWVFVAMSSLVPLDDPLSLTRAVQVMNVVAILLLTVFALTSTERTEGEPWLWSAALVSVNPLMVLFRRKPGLRIPRLLHHGCGFPGEAIDAACLAWHKHRREASRLLDQTAGFFQGLFYQRRTNAAGGLMSSILCTPCARSEGVAAAVGAFQNRSHCDGARRMNLFPRCSNMLAANTIK